MYDSFKIEADISDYNFMNIAAYFDTAKEKRNEHTGEPYVKGHIGNLFVVANKYKLYINGSICKYYLGDNFQTLSRTDTGRAIEMLSDKLHLDITAAKVRRADFGTNIITKVPPGNYLPLLGIMPRYKRKFHDTTLYYKTKDRVLCFYDKNEEAKANGNRSPKDYANKNVLRYEMRYLHRLPTHLKRSEITASNLSETSFYNSLLKEWEEMFMNIVKEKEMNLNFENISGLKDYYTALTAKHIQEIGTTAALEQVVAAQRAGNLKPDAAKDIKRLIKKVAQNPNLTSDNQLIQELETKIKQAAMFG